MPDKEIGVEILDTEMTIPVYGEMHLPEFVDLAKSDLEAIEYHVEITRQIQEVHNLFEMLKYNLDTLQTQYTLRFDDVIISNTPGKTDLRKDYISINALISNLLGSWKSLLQSMDICVTESISTEKDERKQWDAIQKKAYDGSFSYRFLTRLRDFSLHGHVPVSENEGKFCFDLQMIAVKPHYKHNATIKAELEKYAEEILVKYRSRPALALTYTLSEYVYYLLYVYQSFWKIVRSSLEESYSVFLEIVSRYPNNIFRSGLIYKTDGHALQLAVPGDSVQSLDVYEQEAIQICAEYDRARAKIYHPTSDVWVTVFPAELPKP